MAKQDELELDVKAAKPGGKGKIIMLIAAVILLTSGIVIGTLYFMGMLGSKDGTDKAKSEHKGEAKTASVQPTFYLSLAPSFTVNFEDQTHAAYLQVDIQIMAHNQHVLDMVKQNMPLVRNNILLILSAQKFDLVSTRAGKEALQKQILEAIQKIVDTPQQTQEGDKKSDKPAEGAAHDKVVQVYFTSFIMQ